MNNNVYAIIMFSLLIGLVTLTKLFAPVDTKIVIWNIPESKGCVYPTRKIKFIKTELQHLVPYAQVHECHYDKLKRLIKVSTYDFEKGYQMKKPTKEVLYEWSNYRLTQYSTRKASHGNGEVDVEIYRLLIN